MKQLLTAKKNSIPSGSELISITDCPSLPSSLCYLRAPYCDYKGFSYCSGDNVYMPSSLKTLCNQEHVTRSLPSMVRKLVCSYPLLSSPMEVRIVHRYYDPSFQSHLVACYDIKLPGGSFLFNVPEYLLWSSLEDISNLNDCHLVSYKGNLCLVSPFPSTLDNIREESSSSLFGESLPPLDSSLSDDFYLREFLTSNHYPSSKLYEMLTPSVYSNIVRLVECVLQPARTSLGCPIYISSGYRTVELNILVGGSRRSFHLFGRAADIYVPSSCSSNNSDLFDILCELPHVELIKYDSFIHVSL